VRSSAEILRAIRKEVFEYTQKQFGAKLQLKGETISRMENPMGGYRILEKHLRDLREMRAPGDKAALMKTLLAELETALRTELTVPRGTRRAPAPVEAPTVQAQEAQAPVKEEAPPNEAVRRMEALHHAEEARRAEEALRREQAAQHLEGLKRSTEEAVEAMKTWWTQQSSKIDEVMRQRAEQLLDGTKVWWAEERKQLEARAQADARDARAQAEQQSREVGGLVGKAVEAARAAGESAERAEHATAAALKWRRWTAWGAVAAAFVLGPFSTAVLWHSGLIRTRQEDGALLSQRDARPKEAEDSGPMERSAPEEGADTTALDGGTALAQAALQALPIPVGGVPGQRAAPCSADDEEISGFCWVKHQLTAAQVKAGRCETLHLYELSPGWCRAHRAGYLPVYTGRKDNNAVEPQ